MGFKNKHVGVEKKNDDLKKAFYSTNMWDPCTDLLKRDTRLRRNTLFSRPRRSYTKRDAHYWNVVKSERAQARTKDTRPPPSKRFCFDERNLKTMKAPQVRLSYEKVFGVPPPEKMNKPALIQLIQDAL